MWQLVGGQGVNSQWSSRPPNTDKTWYLASENHSPQPHRVSALIPKISPCEFQLQVSHVNLPQTHILLATFSSLSQFYSFLPLHFFLSFVYFSNKVLALKFLFESQLLGELKVRHFHLTEGETKVYKSYFPTFTQLLPECRPRRLFKFQHLLIRYRACIW